MSKGTIIYNFFKNFRHAIGWSLVSLFGIAGYSFATLFLILILYFIISSIIGKDPYKSFKITKKEKDYCFKAYFLAIIAAVIFISGITTGYIASSFKSS